MSSFDELLTTVSDDVRKAIESVCDKAGTFDADWCILKSAGELIATPKLPRVSPDDLVEGEWYVVKYRPEHNGGETAIALCDMETLVYDEVAEDWVECEPFPVFWIVGGEHHYKAQFFAAIWGPIPNFELEGEEKT